MTQRLNGILVTDFDGTMTKYDFYDLVCDKFPEISSKGFWQQYEDGKITHFEALKSIFALIRAPESVMLEIIERMEIEPELNKAVDLLHKHQWQVIVASAGCSWYIQKLLKQKNVVLPVHANQGEFFPDKGLVMSLPQMSPYFSKDIGINKSAVVRAALKENVPVVFAGDGRPDLAPALLVDKERRFAKHWLAKKLHEIDEGFLLFDNWSQIVDVILSGEKSC